MKYNRLDIKKNCLDFIALNVVSDFYYSYTKLIKEQSIDSIRFLKDSHAVSLKYKKYLDNQQHLDYNLILCAQDFSDEELPEGLLFEIINSSDSYYKVAVDISFHNNPYRVIVTLDDEGNELKISGIEPCNSQSHGEILIGEDLP